MSAVAIFAALGVSETTSTAGMSPENLLPLSHAFFITGSIVAFQLSMRNYKYSDSPHTTDIIVHKDKPVCAVILLLDNLHVRGRTEGPSFCWPHNKAICRSYFN